MQRVHDGDSSASDWSHGRCITTSSPPQPTGPGRSYTAQLMELHPPCSRTAVEPPGSAGRAGCAKSWPGISIRRPGARSGSTTRAAGWDPRHEIRGFADLKRFDPFEDEWLRGGPVQRWVPQRSRGQAGVRLRNRRHDRHPQDAHRLRRFPHRLRALQRDAARRVFPERLELADARSVGSAPAAPRPSSIWRNIAAASASASISIRAGSSS